MECGDIGLAMACFGSYDIPIIAITGDIVAVAEAQSWIENLPGAIVKTASVGKRASAAFSQAKAGSLIFDTVVFGVSMCENVKPYKIVEPYSGKVVYNSHIDCDNAIKRNVQKGLKRIDERTVENFLDMIIDFNDLRL